MDDNARPHRAKLVDEYLGENGQTKSISEPQIDIASFRLPRQTGDSLKSSSKVVKLAVAGVDPCIPLASYQSFRELNWQYGKSMQSVH